MTKLQQIKAQQIKDYQNAKWVPLTEDKIMSLFGLEEPLKLPFQLNILETPHPLTPSIKDFCFDPDLLFSYLVGRADRDPMMLVGDKGTGKTSFVEQVHARMGMGLISINGGPGVDEDYLFGRPGFVDGELKDLDGLLSYSIRHGITVCINEISAIPARVQLSMNDVLEQGDVIVLKHHGINPTSQPEAMYDNGNVIVRHPGFHLVATDNTGGKISADPRFNGTVKMNSATRSRFTTLQINHMPREAEKNALLAIAKNHWCFKVSPESKTDQKIRAISGAIDCMLGFARFFRKGFSVGDTSDTISLRELSRWIRKSLSYDCPNRAFEDAIYSALEESDKAFSYEAYLASFGTPFEPRLNRDYYSDGDVGIQRPA
jgi:cobaltochelatase CobS